MKIFKLPDLGEGLTEAEIHEWYIKAGDTVSLDQPVVAMETAKAVVDVPAPRAGTITQLYGEIGDIIDTGKPLFEYSDGEAESVSQSDNSHSVVGSLQQTETLDLDQLGSQTSTKQQQTSIRALPAVRSLARRLKVDLAKVNGSGDKGQITQADVEYAAKATISHLQAAKPLRGVRRSMAQAMSQSHAEVVPVTLVEDADIHAWAEQTDVSLRVIQAMITACKQQPSLNSWFDGQALTQQIHEHINLGIAMDAEDGLFVPVLHDVDKQSPSEIRKNINRFKEEVKTRTIAQKELQGSTIMLSNFGTFAGRYASPIIVPPLVAILGTGRLREHAVLEHGQWQNHRIMPLSLTFDHRAVTGGEAARFLAAVLQSLES